jgi:hypothetical protein
VTGPRVDDQVPHPTLLDDEQLLAAAGFDEASVIAVDASATTYRAVQPELRRTVAVRLQHAPMSDTAARRRFAEQCAILGGLGGHPNIVEVYDCAVGAQNRPFVVMELPAGGTLAQRLERDGPLSWSECLHMAVSLAGALATAHRAGVIHGTVSPDLVLVSAYGPPQLGGFGRFDDERVHGTDRVSDVRSLAAVCAAALGDGADAPPAVGSLFAAPSQGEITTAEDFGRAAQRLQQQLGVASSDLLLRGDARPVLSPPATVRGRGAAVLATAGLLGAVALALVLFLAGREPVPAPLGMAAVAGEWETDTTLAEQLRSTPDAYLCRDPIVAQPHSVQVEAYRSTVTGARVGVVLRRMESAAAGQLLGEMSAQGPCLEQLPGLTEVSTVPFGDDEQGVALQYRRPAAAAPVDIVVLVVRRADTVGHLVHLGYPRTDPEVTRDLQGALTAAVADSAGRE